MTPWLPRNIPNNPIVGSFCSNRGKYNQFRQQPVVLSHCIVRYHCATRQPVQLAIAHSHLMVMLTRTGPEGGKSPEKARTVVCVMLTGCLDKMNALLKPPFPSNTESGCILYQRLTQNHVCASVPIHRIEISMAVSVLPLYRSTEVRNVFGSFQ